MHGPRLSTHPLEPRSVRSHVADGGNLETRVARLERAVFTIGVGAADERLTEREAARRFHVGRERLRAARLRGDLPHHRTGRRVYYWAADLRAWLGAAAEAPSIPMTASAPSAKPADRRVVPVGGRRPR